MSAVATLTAMSDIVLTTLNAKFIHAASRLRHRFASPGEHHLAPLPDLR
ncbi:MAG: hypothetical protein PHY43_15175 [Verrucomicrobiales bacterium]|nr:hypothetical protein [Verrucomicrobiales bacterium]